MYSYQATNKSSRRHSAERYFFPYFTTAVSGIMRDGYLPTLTEVCLFKPRLARIPKFTH